MHMTYVDEQQLMVATGVFQHITLFLDFNNRTFHVCKRFLKMAVCEVDCKIV